MTVLEDARIVLERLNVPGAPKLSQIPAPQARILFRAMIELLERPAPKLARVEDLTIPGPGGDIPLRLYDPVGDGAAGPLLVFYHGGGWVVGDLATHNSLCAEIAHQLSIRVLSVDYRLAPEHPFPAALDDCLAATDWAASSPAVLSGAVTGIVVAGDSAGGNLATVIAQARAQSYAVPFKAQLLIYPVTDFTDDYESLTAFGQGYLLEAAEMDYFCNSYLPDPALRSDPRAAPQLAANLTGQPPAVIFTCGLDPLRDQGRAYAAKLIQAGVSVAYIEAEGQIHGCVNLRKALPSAQIQLTRCLDALRLMLG